jgi:hypothetical protein
MIYDDDPASWSRALLCGGIDVLVLVAMVMGALCLLVLVAAAVGSL